MIKNEVIINKLSISQKLNFITLSLQKKIKDFHVIIEKEQVSKILINVDLKDIFLKNDKEITFEVIEFYMIEIFKKLTSFSSSNSTGNTLIMKNVSDVNEGLNSFLSGVHILTTSNKKKLMDELEEKYENSIDVRADMLSGDLSKEEYEKLIQSADIFPIESINEKVDYIISFVMPFIKEAVKKYVVKREKKVNEISGNIIPKKIIFFGLLSIVIYYNIVLYIIYVNRIYGFTNQSTIVTTLVCMNFFFALALFKFRPKRVKKKVNVYLEMLDEFTEVQPDEQIVTTTRKSVFNNSVNLKEVCDNFYSFLVSKGMLLEHKKIRELFSAMGANRLVFIRNKSYTDLKFLKVLNEFLGNEMYYESAASISSEQELIWVNKHGSAATSDFINGICEATKHSNNMNVVSLIDVNLETCNLYLSSVYNFVKNPNEKGSIKIDMVNEAQISQYMTNGKLPISKNIWFLLFISEDSVATLPKKIIDDSLLIEIEIKTVEPKEYSKEHEVLSFVNFADSITKAREDKYISDELWMKIDEFEQLLKEKYNYTIANGTVRKMEVYASCYNVCGEDEEASIDSAIANVLLPFIFTKKFVDEETAKVVTKMLSDVFGNSTTASKEVLNKYK